MLLGCPYSRAGSPPDTGQGRHALSSRGVFDRRGVFHPADDLDFAALEIPFRDVVLTAMHKRGVIDEERVELIRSWPHSGFRIHSERVIEAGDRRGLESILQYMERAPVSLERLSVLDTGLVYYQPGLFMKFGGKVFQAPSGKAQRSIRPEAGLYTPLRIESAAATQDDWVWSTLTRAVMNNPG